MTTETREEQRRRLEQWLTARGSNLQKYHLARFVGHSPATASVVHCVPPIPQPAWRSRSNFCRETLREIGNIIGEGIREDDIVGALNHISRKYGRLTALHLHTAFDDIARCVHCGNYYYNHETRDVDGETWCNSCVSCDAVYWSSDGEYHAEPEPEPEPEPVIAEYHDSVEHCRRIGPVNHPMLRDIGYELEFCAPRSTDKEEVARELVECSGVAGVEEDGSVRSQNGAEIVSHFGELAEVSKRARGICGVLEGFECKSHDTACCGLHVSIGCDRDNITLYQLARFVVFWNRPENSNWLRLFARRWCTNNDYADGRINYAKADPKKQELLKVQNDEELEADLIAATNHYDLINLENFGTGYNSRVECRAFRGTTKYSTLRACLSLTAWTFAFCEHTERPLTIGQFKKWLSSQDQSAPGVTEILEYAKTREERDIRV